jgi:hypothetical protein
MQLHAPGFEVTGSGCVLRFATQQADGGKAEPLAGSGKRVQVIGVGAAQADNTFAALGLGGLQVVAQLEPFIAADQRVYLIQTQHRKLNAGISQPGKCQTL